MSFLSKLFGKKKETKRNYNTDVDDGQDLYFREDFEEKPKKKSTTVKKAPATSNSTDLNETKTNKKDIKVKAEEKSLVNKPAPKAADTKATIAEPKAKVDGKRTAPVSEKKPVKKASTSPAIKPEAKKNATVTKQTAKQLTDESVKAASTPKKDSVAKASPATNQKEEKSGKSGKFEIKKAKDGRYVFNLYAPNHIIVATSQVYSSASSAVNGIQSIIANAEKAPVEDNTLKSPIKQSFPKWEMYIDKGGEYRFRLYASNGNCVVHSQGYKQKSSCKNGIESIIRCSRNAEIDKSYLKKE